MLLDALNNLQIYYIRELLRPAKGARDETADITIGQRSAVLMAAYFTGAPFVFGWLRQAFGGPIDLFVSGRRLMHPQNNHTLVALSFPSGAAGEPKDTGILWSSLEGIAQNKPTWVSLTGAVDAFGADQRHDQDPPGRHVSIEDCIGGAFLEPFAWIVVAMPVPPTEIQQQSSALAVRLPALREQRGGSQERAFDLERDEAWYRELRKGEQSGLWRVQILVGAASQESVFQIAGLISGSADVEDMPYILKPEPSGPTELSKLARAAGERANGPPPARSWPRSRRQRRFGSGLHATWKR